jgi:hypothetical protein
MMILVVIGGFVVLFSFGDNIDHNRRNDRIVGQTSVDELRSGVHVLGVGVRCERMVRKR